MTQIIDIPIKDRMGRTTLTLALLKGYRSMGINASIIVSDDQRMDLIRRYSVPDDWLVNFGAFHFAPHVGASIYLVDDAERIELLWKKRYPDSGGLRVHLDNFLISNPMRKVFMFTQG